MFCLCWGLTSQSTIFQSCRDGATASWVINQYFRGVKCLAQGHNTAAVGLEPPTSRSGVRDSTTEPPRSPFLRCHVYIHKCLTLLRRLIFLYKDRGRVTRSVTKNIMNCRLPRTVPAISAMEIRQLSIKQPGKGIL